MAYGRNFGMRSFENVVRDARFRVPALGTPLKIGEPVMLDSVTQGYLKPATAAAAPGPNTGIVVFEHIQNKSDQLTTEYDSPYDSVPLGVYAQIMHGPGTKVWFKNTAQKTLYDGRVRAAFSFTSGTALAVTDVGKGLIPDGAGKWKLGNGTTDVSWLIIEQVVPFQAAAGGSFALDARVEARFTF